MAEGNKLRTVKSKTITKSSRVEIVGLKCVGENEKGYKGVKTDVG